MKLSIVIPARNEMFLEQTIKDILSNIEDDTEIIAVLDGQWSDNGIEQHERVNVVYVPESIGQRAACNLGVRLSEAKYIMKIDAHCAFDKGFDRKLMADMQDDWTVVPIMKNLHAFDWKCPKCGKKVYQDVIPICPVCKTDMQKKMIWKPRKGTHASAYQFNKELEFKYWSDYERQQTGNIADTMSLQGSCFMLTREKYIELNICDESWGSWGGQGAEVALKTWLSGGQVKVNKNTWYAHMFRTKSNFGFPYPNNGSDQKRAKDKLREIFLNDKWDKAIYPLSWLVEKFNPPTWGK